jgi:hypothetical protein
MRAHPTYDVAVCGAGIGGISAVIAAARLGARTLLIEERERVGGTGVHSPVGMICTYFDAGGRFINTGLHKEFFPELYAGPPQGCMSYDEGELLATYERLLAAEPLLTVRTSACVTGCVAEGGRIVRLDLHDGSRVKAEVFIDSTADGNLSALAGASFELGRAADGLLQPATLTFRAGPVELRAFGLEEWRSWASVMSLWDQLRPLYLKQKAAGATSNPNAGGVLAVPSRDGASLLFNHTRIHRVDPTDADSMQAAMREGRKQVAELWDAIRGHPAFARAAITHISRKLGVREGRRILGDYLLSETDCLGEARFPDMVAACGYAIDIHNPEDGTTRLVRIPNSGYYHIPYRCLIPRGMANLLLGSRCISGTHEAHSSYRVMAPVSAIGQAAGTAAALHARRRRGNVREVGAAAVQEALRAAGQFVESA